MGDVAVLSYVWRGINGRISQIRNPMSGTISRVHLWRQLAYSSKIIKSSKVWLQVHCAFPRHNVLVHMKQILHPSICPIYGVHIELPLAEHAKSTAWRSVVPKMSHDMVLPFKACGHGYGSQGYAFVCSLVNIAEDAEKIEVAFSSLGWRIALIRRRQVVRSRWFPATRWAGLWV